MPEKKKNRLRVQREIDVPLREVSGICLRRSGRARTSLVAVGDRAAKLAWTELPRSDDGELDWQTIDIAGLPVRAAKGRCF